MRDSITSTQGRECIMWHGPEWNEYLRNNFVYANAMITVILRHKLYLRNFDDMSGKVD